MAAMKKIFHFLVLLSFSFSLFACATGRDTGIVSGGAIGAGTGAAIDRKNPWRGAIIGGLIGAFAGGVIGDYADRQKKDRSQSVREVRYKPAQGNVVRIEEISIRPQNIRPGQTISLEASYYTLCPQSKTKVRITESRKIQYGGEDIIDPMTREVVKDQGLSTSSVDIFIPKEAELGEYSYVITISNGNKQDQRTYKFYVRNS